MFCRVVLFRLVLLGCGLFVLSRSAGCNPLEFAPRTSTTETITKDFQTSASPLVIVETFNGSIDMSDADGNEVVAEITKHASGFNQEAAEANLENVRITVEQRDNTVRIFAEQVGSHHGNLGASMVIAVPKNAQLKLRTSNGPIVSESVQGEISADTSNGQIAVVDGRGAIDAHTSNGKIEVEAADAKLNARTSNGAITFRGAFAAGESKLRTSNGRIRIELAENSAARFECSTSNGAIHSDFPVTTEEKHRGTRLKGTIGEEPRASFTAVTSNAPIDIRKLQPREK